MNYIELFENLSTERIENCEAFVNADIHFKDPFNDITGITRFKHLLHKTLKDVTDPRFVVTHQAKDKDVLFLKWEFSGTVKVIGHWFITGMSEIHLDDQGKVVRHVDHWDASEQFYGHIPVLGSLLRLIRRRLQVS